MAGRCERVADCAAQLARTPADLALVDLDGDDGAEGVSALYAQTQIRILAISGSRDTALHDGAVLAGARGVIGKRDPPELLLKAIEKVHAGELWVDRAATSRRGRRRPSTRAPSIRKSPASRPESGSRLPLSQATQCLG